MNIFLFDLLIITERQTKFEKVIFLHLSVNHSAHREEGGLHPGGLHPGGWVCIQGDLHQGESASGGAASRGGWVDQAPYRILLDTVNERAVRILLECILFSQWLWKYDNKVYVSEALSWSSLNFSGVRSVLLKLSEKNLPRKGLELFVIRK